MLRKRQYMKSESELQQLIQLAGPMFGCILLRNNSGCLKDSKGRLVRFGIGNVSERHNEISKSSDLIGITEIVITPDMVGKTVGVFTAIEVKREDWQPRGDKREKAQQAFIDWVIARGGIAGFANSVERFKQILKR